jgi:hypothetical protein
VGEGGGEPFGRRRARAARDGALALIQEAALNRVLWADARLDLGEEDRAVILASAAEIERAARALARPSWWRRLLGRGAVPHGARR